MRQRDNERSIIYPLFWEYQRKRNRSQNVDPSMVERSKHKN